MRRTAIAAIAAAACSFSGPGQGGGDLDAGIDAPPASPEVRFTSITADVSEIRPGLYGFRVTAVLENGLDTEITRVGVSLDVQDGGVSRDSDFGWREPDAREGVTAPQPTTIAAGESQTYELVVDALASAAPPGLIEINATATFESEGSKLSATPAETPLELPFAAGLNSTIVVDTAADEQNGNGDTSLREAIALANQDPGPDRITFVSGLEITLAQALPPISEDLVIDGSGTAPVVAFNASAANNAYGIRLSAGTAVVSGLTFRDMGFAYPELDLTGDNCGGQSQLEGGAVRVDNGTLILDGNTFEDPNVAERNCFAASVRVHGGSGHRILRNHWTAPSMDSLYVDAPAIEISDNVIDSNPDPGKSDECIYVDGQGGQDLWIAGNLCVDQEFSGVVARGTDGGVLRVAHNTFVRTGISALAAVRRETPERDVELRNNAYVSNRVSIGPDNSGADFNIAFEASSDGTFCSACDNATVDSPSLITDTDLILVNSAGTSAADLSPALGSPLLNSAELLLDRNGKTPGWFGGAGAERGAIER